MIPVAPRARVQEGQRSQRPTGRPAAGDARWSADDGRWSSPPAICFPFVHDSLGGSYISALNLVGQIDRRRFRPLIVLPDGSGQLARWARAAGLDFQVLPTTSGRSFGRRIFGIAGLVKYLRDLQIRIVHTNDGATHLSWGPAARLAGARLVWHHRHGPEARSYRCVAPWLASEVIAVSRFAVSGRGLLGRRRSSRVIHSPFDTSIATIDRQAARAMLLEGLDAGDRAWTVAYFGTLIQRKRPVGFVEAVATLIARDPSIPVHGLMFGKPLEPGIEEAIRARAAALGIGDRIRLMGFRYPPERWLAGCDVLLVPAVDEPFGRTLIEAMLLGTPVVAAASGGNPEAITDDVTGLLVPPDRPAACAAALERLYRDPALAGSLAKAAQRDALARFSLEGHARAVMRVYDQLLSPRR